MNNFIQNDELLSLDFEKKYMINKTKLEGVVCVSGAKNSALKLLSASILTKEKIVLTGFPVDLIDIKIHQGMLNVLGKSCYVENDRLEIIERNEIKSKLDWKGKSIRNTLLILAALVARTQRGSVPLPGGCQLGERKYDLHELVLKGLGADVWVENGCLLAEAKNGLVGSDIHLPLRSTGATESAIIAGCLAKGTTCVWNPHIRPEVIDLINFLRTMGADIHVYGQERIEIKGKESLEGTKYHVLSDNMEAITWLIASVVTDGDVQIENFPFEDLEVPLVFLRESGAKYYKGNNCLIVRGGKPYPVDISTGPYPGINSDMQPLFAIYGACSKGESSIIDLRFPGRYGYVQELEKMGLKYNIEGNMLKIDGGTPLRGAVVRALDLRAGISLILAGTTAQGETIIEDAWQVERGYNSFVNKFRALNGNISLLQ